MIHYTNTTNKWEFDLPHHNVNKSNYKLIFNQLFVDETLHVLNTNTGRLYTNTIDLDKVDLLKLYNWCPDCEGRFSTKKNGKNVKIYELIVGLKTNQNWVINHIDGDPSNNTRSNLELVTNWFNIALMKKSSGLPIGIKYNRGGTSYQTIIRMPRIHDKFINFGSKDQNCLQNIHYQFATKSGVVSPERYLKEVPNWLPDSTIQFTPEHQSKLNQLIEAHLENQLTWDAPIMF
jgi:hypothetical protein